MSLLVATDLDRTMIYSRKAAAALGAADGDTVCAEIHDGVPASFMTARAAELMRELSAAATFVPVTTRIDEQYRRVQLPSGPPRYAITTNGGVILVDGVPDAGWTSHVARTLADAFPLDEVWNQVAQVCHPEFTDKVRNAAGMFCYAVVQPHKLPSGFVADVSGWAAERGWRLSLQGRKLYWVPEQLTKSAAVAEVATRIGADCVVAAGDSLLDVDLLLGADRAIHPRHGELHEEGWSAPTVRCTTSRGIAAGEEIVQWFTDQLAA